MSVFVCLSYRQKHREDLHNMDPFAERKYIICESQLEVLLSVCRACAKPCQVVKKGECGTSVEYASHCECGHRFTWASQPFSRQLPLVNLLLAAATFFTACSATHLLNVLKFSSIACFTRQTYNKIQGAYLVPAVRHVWENARNISSWREEPRLSSWLGTVGVIHLGIAPNTAVIP